MDTKLDYTSATPRDFPLSLLQRITNDFCKESIVGRGGYGIVYKGVIDNGEEIAIKKLKNQLGLENDQFINEVMNLMDVQHQNVIRLVGYCYETRNIVSKYNGRHVFASVEERLLCLEYMHGGSLEKLLSDESCGLEWEARYKIIKGMCEGLKYLQTGSNEPIYHLDLKPANILLDKDMIPKIGDFGLSRLLGTQTHVTKTIAGSLGYMPPEYIVGQQVSLKSDVFSLGVIIIQVIAGMEGYYKCADMPSQEFIDLVSDNWQNRVQAKTMSLGALLEVQTCIKIALRCIDINTVKKPSIAQIVEELNMIDLPVLLEAMGMPCALSSKTSDGRLIKMDANGYPHFGEENLEAEAILPPKEMLLEDGQTPYAHAWINVDGQLIKLDADGYPFVEQDSNLEAEAMLPPEEMLSGAEVLSKEMLLLHGRVIKLETEAVRPAKEKLLGAAVQPTEMLVGGRIIKLDAQGYPLLNPLLS